jgi:CubicO group peptidase (beta-lactamase class C family)
MSLRRLVRRSALRGPQIRANRTRSQHIRSGFTACQLLLLSLLALAGSQVAFAQEKNDWAWLDDFVQSSMKDWKVPGVSIAIVRDQSVVYMKGFGVRDIRNGKPVTTDTLFDIGSCTKAFTTAAIAMLVDEGKMQWDGKVGTYIPFFHLEDPLADENVTIRDLLTHRTGVPPTDLLWYGSDTSRQEVIRNLAHVTPSAGFRARFQYQNGMYVAAGYAAGQVAGSTWDDLVRTRIFAPLGMTKADTSAIDAQKSPDYATPHDSNPDGSVKAISWQNIDNAGPAGSINSSARDMAKWLILQLNDGAYEGKQLISNKNMREMQAAQMVISLEGEIPTIFFPDSTQLSYGLGWFIQQYREHQLVLHAGDIDGFSTMVVLIPEMRTAYFVVINLGSSYRQALSYYIADHLLNLPDARWSEHFKQLEAKRIAEEKSSESWESKKTPGTHPSRKLPAYAGTYENIVYGPVKIKFQDGKLTFRFHSKDSALDHFQYDTFVTSLEGKTRVTFCLDDDGNVASLRFDGIDFKRAVAGQKR